MYPLAIILLLSLPLAQSAQAIELQDGDIIFHRSQSRQSKAIAAATDSRHTHMGIIFFEHHQPYVYEAIQPVSKTPLQTWINRGQDRKHEIKRLKDTSKLDKPALKASVLTMMKKDYDWLFDWSDDRIYCSELVWKSYETSSGLRLGELRKLSDFNLNNDFVKKIMQERYGKNIPLNMTVIAPSDIFNSPLLITIPSE